MLGSLHTYPDNYVGLIFYGRLLRFMGAFQFENTFRKYGEISQVSEYTKYDGKTFEIVFICGCIVNQESTFTEKHGQVMKHRNWHLFLKSSLF